MKRYIYPRNLKAEANMWLWSLRDFAILCMALLLSALALVRLRLVLPLALTIGFGFLSIRFDDSTVLDCIRWAVRYFITAQQYYEWSERK